MDIDDEKLELAKRLGASMVINSKTENVVERVRELTDGYMADVVIEAVGSPVTYVTAIDIVAFTGRVACIAMPRVKWLSRQNILFRRNSTYAVRAMQCLRISVP